MTYLAKDWSIMFLLMFFLRALVSLVLLDLMSSSNSNAVNNGSEKDYL